MSSIKYAHAFAQFSRSLILELQDDFNNNLVPQFNSEAEDIRREWEEKRPVCEALADHKKRARAMDLVVRRRRFIDDLNTRLKMELNLRVEEYEGKQEEDKVVFPDESIAKMPKAFFVDYRVFQRI